MTNYIEISEARNKCCWRDLSESCQASGCMAWEEAPPLIRHCDEEASKKMKEFGWKVESLPGVMMSLYTISKPRPSQGRCGAINKENE